MLSHTLPMDVSTNSVQKKAPKTDEQLHAEWKEKWGEKAADWIRDSVKKCEADYEYLKQFAIKPPSN